METITELKNQIAKQAEEIEFLRAILDTVPMLVYFKDTNSAFQYANKYTYEIIGFDAEEELLGKTDYDLHPKEMADIYVGIEQKILQTGQAVRDLEESIALKGSEFGDEFSWYLTNKIPMEKDGEVVGFVASLYEITEYKKQQKRAEERDTLRLMIDNLPIVMYVKDRDGNHIVANQLQSDLCGVDKPEDLIGKHDRDLHLDGWQEFHEDEQHIMITGEPIINKEEQVTNKDNQELWYLTTKIPLHGENGNITKLIGFGVDITDQKKAELEAEEQRKVIEKQRQTLLDLSAPIIPITDDIIIMPLIGNIDGERGQIIMRSLLAGISQFSAKTVILDLTGVSIIDTEVAGYLHRSTQAVKLKGAKAIITGITEEIAETIVDLGIDWTQVETWRDLQSGLQTVL